MTCVRVLSDQDTISSCIPISSPIEPCQEQLPTFKTLIPRCVVHKLAIMRSYSAIMYRSVRSARPSTPLVQQRFFTPATQLRVRHTGQSPEEIEKTKQEQIKKQEQGKGEWHEKLASSSESHVKADQEKVHDHDAHIEDLQKETAKQAEKEQK